MAKNARKRSSATAKRRALVRAVRRIAPFLFRAKKRPAVARAAHAKRPTSAKRTKKRTRKAPRKSAKKSHATTVKSAAAAPVAEKKSSARSLPSGKPPAEKKSAGFIVEQERDIAREASPDAQSDAFLQKVKMKSDERKKVKRSTWESVRDRLFDRRSKQPKQSEQKRFTISKKELAEDSFLRRVERKKVDAVVGTAVDEELQREYREQKEEPAESLDELLGAEGDESPRTSGKPSSQSEKFGMLSSAELRKEAREAKEAAARTEAEVRSIKKELQQEQKKREKEMRDIDLKREKEKSETPPVQKAPSKRSNKEKSSGGFAKFIAAVGHIGLGKERMNFVQNMATMLNAGLPLIDAIRTLQLETRVKPMKKLLQRILDDVENGSPLWRAMDRRNFFSLHAISLVRIGEEAGNLAENVEYLALQEEKDHALRAKVKMAMIYPTIVLTIMFIIVIGLGMFVLPNLIGVLYSLNVELPFITRMVIAFTNMFTEYGAVAVPGSIGGMALLVILAKFTRFKVVTQWVMFRIPGIGALAREATIARFGVILGGLLKAGVPVVDAMDSLVEVTPIMSYRRLYAKMRDRIVVGDSFSKSFQTIKKSQKLLPPSVQQLVITGEKSGALADIMLKIADIYDKKASETAQKLPVILEPMLLLVIGGLVGTIAFSIIVPIYSIVGSVGR